MPDYVMDWLLARWIGVPVWELDDVPMRILDEARVVMSAAEQVNRKGRSD